MMVDRFNSYDTVVMLNLYLMINCIVLDIDLYVDDTIIDRENMIEDIIHAINSFSI